MKNKLFKNIAVIAIFVFLFFFVFLFSAAAAVQVSAQPDLGFDYANNLDLSVADEADPKQMAVDVVKYLMTFLGIIAVVVILYGGFMWMTASGNEDRVDKAKKIIIAGAIGLVIVLAAYAIVNFVVNITNDVLEDTL